MRVHQALILGVVQGLTEFLPVSSSAHLVFLSRLLRWRRHSFHFDVAVHLGCFVALLAYFRRDWLLMAHNTTAWIGGGPAHVDPLLGAIFLACIPAVLAGVLFEKSARGRFRRLPWVALLTALMGVLLIFADHAGRPSRDLNQFGWCAAMVIGLSQALALLPGVSRSGITVTAGVLLGFTLPAAVRFSFLLATPILAGAGLWGLRHLPKHGIPPGERASLAVGFLTAASVGYPTIAWMFHSIAVLHLTPFGMYRILLALAIWGTVRFLGNRGEDESLP